MQELHSLRALKFGNDAITITLIIIRFVTRNIEKTPFDMPLRYAIHT